MFHHRVHIIAKCSTDPHSPDITVSSVVSASYTAVNITNNDNIAAVLHQHVKVAIMTVAACLTTMQQKFVVDSNILAWHWGIRLHKVKRTVQCTTQHGVMKISKLTLGQRFCTNDHMLCYCHQYHTILPITCMPVPSPSMATSVLRSSAPKKGQVLALWRQKVQHMTDYPLCFNMRSSHP